MKNKTIFNFFQTCILEITSTLIYSFSEFTQHYTPNQELEPASSFTQTASSKSPDVWSRSPNGAQGTQPGPPSSLSNLGAPQTQPESPSHLNDSGAPITQAILPTQSSCSQGPLSGADSNKGHSPVQVTGKKFLQEFFYLVCLV